MFVVLADHLFAAKTISVSVADNAKDQFDEFLKVTETQHKKEFLKFISKQTDSTLLRKIRSRE